MAYERFRKEIKARYKSEGELARALGWTRQKMSKTVLGQRSPKISDINALSKEMAVPVSEVIKFFDE